MDSCIAVDLLLWCSSQKLCHVGLFVHALPDLQQVSITCCSQVLLCNQETSHSSCNPGFLMDLAWMLYSSWILVFCLAQLDTYLNTCLYHPPTEDHLGASSTQGILVLSNHLFLLVQIQDVSSQKHTSQFQSDCNHFIIVCAPPFCSARSLKFRSLSDTPREIVVSTPWWYFRAWCRNVQFLFYVDFQTWLSSNGKS